jgi:hypothetical protein
VPTVEDLDRLFGGPGPAARGTPAASAAASGPSVDDLDRLFGLERPPRARAEGTVSAGGTVVEDGPDDPGFRTWYAKHAQAQGLHPDPDDPTHQYDYRAAYRAGAAPDATGHWPSTFKLAGHPNLIVDGKDTRTGQPVPPPVARNTDVPVTTPLAGERPIQVTPGLDQPDAAGRTPTGRRLAAAQGAIMPDAARALVMSGQGGSVEVGPGVESSPDIARRVAADRPEPGPAPPMNAAERIGRGVGTGVAGAVASVAGGAELLARQVGIPEDLFRDFRLAATEVADTLGVKDPTYADKLFQGIGSLAAFLVPGMGAAAVSARIMQIAPRLARLTGVAVEGLGQALSGAGETYSRVLAETGDATQAVAAGNRAAVGNALLLTITQRFSPILGTGRLVRRGLRSGAGEAIEEGMQTGIGATAAGQQAPSSEILEAASIGGILGAGGGAVIRGPQAAPREAAAQAEAERRTLPESPRAVRAQLNALARGDKPAVEVPLEWDADFRPGAQRRGERIRVAQLPNGNALYYSRPAIEAMAPPGLSGRMLDRWVAEEYRAGRAGRLLGYGVDAKPTPGDPTSQVQVQDDAGREVQTVLTRPGEAETAAAAVAPVTPEGGQVEVTPPPASGPRILETIRARQAEAAEGEIPAPPADRAPGPAPASQEGISEIPSREIPLEPGQALLPTGSVKADPGRFQFKLAGLETESGASGTFDPRQRYDPARDRNGLLVWRDPADGQVYVINGHNRLNLAKSQGVPQIRVRFLQAPNAETARTLGVVDNLVRDRRPKASAEQGFAVDRPSTTGTSAQDAAAFFREYGLGPQQLRAFGVDPDSPLVREGLRLAGTARMIGPTEAELRVEAGPEAAPTRVREVPLAELDLEPDRFQFKVSNREKSGSTGSLTGVRRWDPNLAGVVAVWRDPADQRLKVLNGHNRVNKARELGAAGDPSAPASIAVLEVEAETAEQARAVGALMNIAEGRGTAFDAAKFFRDTGLTAETLRTQGVPMRESVVREGLALGNLTAPVFARVQTGKLSTPRAVLIGERVQDPDAQLKLVQALERLEKRRPLRDKDVAELAGMAASAPTRAVTEETLFGTDTRQEAAVVEKAKLVADLRDRLSQDKRLFSTVSKSRAAQRLQAEGNVIDVARSQGVSQEAAVLLELFDRLKHVQGPVADVLNQGAARLAAGEGRHAVREQTYSALRKALPQALRGGPGGRPAGATAGDAAPDVPRGRAATAVPPADLAARVAGEPELEGVGAAAPRVEKTEAGDQYVMPGTERREMSAGPIRKGSTKPPLESERSERNLFNFEARDEADTRAAGQGDLFGAPADLAARTAGEPDLGGVGAAEPRGGEDPRPPVGFKLGGWYYFPEGGAYTERRLSTIPLDQALRGINLFEELRPQGAYRTFVENLGDPKAEPGEDLVFRVGSGRGSGLAGRNAGTVGGTLNFLVQAADKDLQTGSHVSVYAVRFGKPATGEYVASRGVSREGARGAADEATLQERLRERMAAQGDIRVGQSLEGQAGMPAAASSSAEGREARKIRPASMPGAGIQALAAADQTSPRTEPLESSTVRINPPPSSRPTSQTLTTVGSIDPSIANFDPAEVVRAPGRTRLRTLPERPNTAPLPSEPTYEAYQDTADVPTLLARAEDDRPQYEQRLRRLAVDTPGLTFPDRYPPRVKSDAKHRITEKLQARPGDAWVDYLGGRVWIDAPGDAARVLEAVGREFPVVDIENFLEKPKIGGYRAIHVAIELPTGLIAELQLVGQDVGAVQDAGWKIYEKWRGRKVETLTPAERAERAADIAKSEALFGGAHAKWLARAAATPARSVGAAAPTATASDTDLVVRATGRAGVDTDTGTNLDRLDTAVDVKYLYSQLHQQHHGHMMERRRGTMTLEEIERLSLEAGLDEGRIRRRVLGGTLNAEQITQARNILLASAERLAGIKAEYRTLQHEGQPIPDALVDRFARAAAAHIALQGEVEGATTEIARALAAHRILAKSAKAGKPLEGKALQAALELFGGEGAVTGERGEATGARNRARTLEVLELAAALPDGDTRGLSSFLRKAQERRWSDKLYEAWLSSILSGPQSHAANMIGNTLFMASNTAERTLAGGIDAVLAKLTGRQREVFAREGMAEVAGMLSALTSGRALGKAVAAWQLETRADLGRVEARPPAIGGRAGRVIRAPLRALSAEDAAFKAMVWDAEIHAGALRIALQEGHQGEALARRMSALIADPTPGMLLRAQGAQDYRTFQQKLGKMGQWVLWGRETIPALRYVIPFVRTPANIMKATLERTPLGFVPVVMRARRGEYTQGQRELGGVPRALAEDLARPFLGSMVMLAAGALAAAGYVTGGGGGEDRDTLRTKREAGWQPYSVTVPGVGSFAYNRLEPVGGLLGMAADIVELARGGEEQKAAQKADAMLRAVAQNITNKTFLGGLLGLSNMLADPLRYGESWLEGQARGMIPAGGLLGSIARGLDDTEREIEGPVAAMQAQLPGLRNQLPAKRGALGGALTSGETALERMVSPIRRNAPRPDKAVERELARVGYVPAAPPRSLTVDREKVELLERERRLYHRTWGAEAREDLLGLLEDPAYRALDRDEQKREIQSIVHRAQRDARGDLLDGVRERLGR